MQASAFAAGCVIESLALTKRGSPVIHAAAEAAVSFLMKSRRARCSQVVSVHVIQMKQWARPRSFDQVVDADQCL
jgi:hypothetical protein